VANLTATTTPFHTLGIDLKEVVHKDRKFKFLVMVDEASRLTRCALIFDIDSKKHRNATTEEIVCAYESFWEELFGPPRVIHHDPEGALVSNKVMQVFADKNIRLDATAGESHWQLGITERMIATIFNSAERIAYEGDIEFPRAVSLAVRTQNTNDRVRGYTPSQWAFGRNPSWREDLHDDDTEEISLSRNASDQFAELQRLRIKARNIYETEILHQRLLRAQRAQTRKDKNFVPGETVYVWRQGLSKLAGTSKTGLHRGQWFGPGHVLGTETHIERFPQEM
jgi:hypothetical protein